MIIKFPVGTTAENDQLNLPAGFITLDVERKALRMFDGETQGGFEILGMQAYYPPIPLGESWDQIASPTTSYIHSIIFFKNYFYIFPTNSTVAYRSLDGNSWSAVTLPESINTKAYVSGDGTVMGYVNTSTHKYVYTRNGTTWAAENTQYTQDVVTAAGANNSSVGMFIRRGVGTRPANGDTITGVYYRDASSGSVSNYNKGVNNADALRVVSRVSPSVTHTRSLAIMSRDTSLTLPTLVTQSGGFQTTMTLLPTTTEVVATLGLVKDIYAYGNYYFIAAGDGRVARMGISSSSFTFYDAPSSAYKVQGFCDASGRLYAYTRQYIGWSTDNGVTWNSTQGPESIPSELASMAFGNNMLLCVGQSGVILKSVAKPGSS